MNTAEQIVEFFESDPCLMDLNVPNWPYIPFHNHYFFYDEFSIMDPKQWETIKMPKVKKCLNL